MGRRSTVLLLWAGMSSALAGDVAGPSLTVCVTGRTPTADEAEQIAATAAKAEAAQVLEAALQKEYGKKEKAWPGDKQAAMREARVAAYQSKLATGELIGQQRQIEDSVRGIRKKLAGKANIQQVERAEGADLVVEILGRHFGENDAAVISFRLQVGPTLDVALLADKALKAPNVFAVQEQLHGFSLEEPFWDFEISSAWTSLGAWGASEGRVAAKVDSFVKANQAVLLASRLASSSAARPPR